MISGQTKLGETAKEILAEKGTVYRFIKIRAGASNAADIFVGVNKEVTKETGFPIAKGVSETFELFDPAVMYVIGTENDTFSYIAY